MTKELEKMEKEYCTTPYGFDKCPYCGADLSHTTVEDDDGTPPFSNNYSVLLFCEDCERYFSLTYKVIPYYAEVYVDGQCENDSVFLYPN